MNFSGTYLTTSSSPFPLPLSPNTFTPWTHDESIDFCEGDSSGGWSWRERGEMAPAVRLGAQQAHKSSVPAAAARVHPRHVDTPDKQAINPALKEPLGSIPFIQPLSHVLRPLYCMHMCARQRRGAHSSPINHTHVYTNVHTHLLSPCQVSKVSPAISIGPLFCHTMQRIYHPQQCKKIKPTLLVFYIKAFN